jgi:hypothetical protein
MLDLARGLPTTAQDVAVLRRLKAETRPDTAAYLRALARLPQPTTDALRARGGPRGEPFVLDDPQREP